MIGKILVSVPPVEQAEREYREAVRAEALAMRSRAAAETRLFAARQVWCADYNAALPEGSTGHLFPCRDCLQAVPLVGGGHEMVSDVGAMLYARCGGEPR